MTPIKRDKVKVDFLEAYDQSACNVSIACKKVGISRNTFYQWKKDDIQFAEECKEKEESLLDFAETMLYKAIKEGKTAELIFFLKTKGQSRGYVEKQAYSITQDEPDLSGLSTEQLVQLISDYESKQSGI
jgi:hypothetical protein